MMDLRTVKENLSDEQYESVEECLADVQLIWDNCKVYNTEDSLIYKMALSMEGQTAKLTQEIFGQMKKPTRTAALIRSKDSESENSGVSSNQNFPGDQAEIQAGCFGTATRKTRAIHGVATG